MTSAILLLLASAFIAVVSYVYLAVSASLPREELQRLSAPGPILRGRATAANLDGLTLVRTLRLPTIKLVFPGIGRMSVKNSTSEMVFKRLRLHNMVVNANDVSAGDIVIQGNVDADFTGLCSLDLDLLLTLPGMKPKSFRIIRSGKLAMKLSGLSLRLPVHLGVTAKGQPGMRHTSFAVAEGKIETLTFTGAPMAHLATKVPLWLSIQPVANFLLSAVLKEDDLKDALARGWLRMKPFLDVSSWEGVPQSLRNDSLAPLTNQHTTAFQAHAVIAGQTAIVDIPIPDQSPSLYREGGKRAYLQSWNKLTSEAKFDITEMFIRRLGFDKALLEWNTAILTERFRRDDSHAHEHIMECRLENFQTIMAASFRLYANMGKPLQLVTGLQSYGEGGKSRTLVRAARLSLVFAVGIDEGGVSIRTLHIDDFDSIDVTIEGLKGKRDDLVNQMLKFLKGQIANVASRTVKQLLEREVKRGTGAFEKIEQTLLDQGVEVPGLFRATSHDSSTQTLSTTSAT